MALLAPCSRPVSALTAALLLLLFSGGLKKVISPQARTQLAASSQEGFRHLTNLAKKTKHLILKANAYHFAAMKTFPIT